MALRRERFDITARLEAKLPAKVAQLVHAGNERIERFQATHVVAGFVPSDFAGAYAALLELAHRRNGAGAPGQSFCEWGSGFGVVACLAATCGFDAWGIEVNETLVAESQQLAADFELPVQFHCGSFLPADAAETLDENCADAGDGFYWMDFYAKPVEDEMGLAIEDFDVVYAYPWPGEEDVVFTVFDRYAALGAVLLTFHGLEGFHLHRKVKGDAASERRRVLRRRVRR